MKRSRLLLLLSMILVAMMVLSACGGDDGDAGTDSGESSDNPVEAVATEVVDATDDEAGEDMEEPATDEGETAAGASCEITYVAGNRLEDFTPLQPLVDQFEADNPGVSVNIVAGPESATDRLGTYLQCFAQECTDFDLMEIDVIWPGDLAEHLVDLKPYVDQEVMDSYFPAIVENNTVDGRLVGIPMFTDAPLLYYRTDLLEKYGYDGPPETWEELEEMATTIQEGEQAENQDFVGYVWQGDAYEGLTCDALEWVASHDGGSIVSPEGVITINNDNAIRALEMGARFVGTISPEGVTGFKEEDSRNVWHAGNAAFMRNWPYAYSLSRNEDSAVVDKFGAVPLPRAEGSSSGGACLGGWQLAVSKYSQCQEEAGQLAAVLTGPDAQRIRALESSLIPTIQTLYDEEDVAAAVPPNMRDVLLNATPRPSTATAPNYNEVSNLFFANVHSVLTGQMDAEDAVAEIELSLEDLLGFETGAP